MTEHRDSPEVDRAEGPPPPPPSRRFARLILDASRGRRGPTRRLVAAALGVSTVALIGGFAGLRAIRALTDWVADRPDQTIPFSEIELVPEPPPWVASGSAGLLESVRAEARLPSELSLLKLDLDAIRTDFKRCPWVEKVEQVRRDYRHLSVRLAYRKPVAVVGSAKKKVRVIDRDTNLLPYGEIDWTPPVEPRFQPRGLPDALIIIYGVTFPDKERPGLAWNRPIEVEPSATGDLRIVGAARLAAFLQDQTRTTPKGRTAPSFVELWPPEPNSKGFKLQDERGNCVNWGEPPGSESPNEPRASEKWARLLNLIDQNGPLALAEGEILQFTPKGTQVVRTIRGDGR